ncbi:hypothetical protein Hoch_1021 [Haliangium ochraceum DSM 14365]|uniref:Uncharacterized protein n=1 Tax=Haliangium ochraceum (strain DSM 14365 / JCM 11303 / SMP-2) TaxID=502025 RepID=D0LQQ8_HALO1|nr:hypothetical protein Hoch_1021 [Haliangium ochraceum DSM 14365]
MSKSNSGRTGNPVGRPKKNSDRRVPYEEVDRLLVFGEVVACDDGKGVTTVYPSFREVARRYGVSHSVVTSYAQRHNCMRRREIAQARIEAKTDEKLTEMRANRFALTKDDELRIIDRYLSEFEDAVAAKRVPCDNPSDFNTMLRLKQFIQGGADSRQEVHAGFSLEALQARHRRMLRHLDEGDDAGRTSAADERDPETTPPALSSEPAPAELVAGRLDTFVSDRVSEARGNLPSTLQTRRAKKMDARTESARLGGRPVGPSGCSVCNGAAVVGERPQFESRELRGQPPDALGLGGRTVGGGTEPSAVEHGVEVAFKFGPHVGIRVEFEGEMALRTKQATRAVEQSLP